MLRDCDPERKTSDKPCPHCGAAGNYTGHGGYGRWLDDGSGARRVRVNRVRCRSCGKTHALIWRDMAPFKLRSEGLHLRTFRSWAAGSSMQGLLAATGIPRTSLRRMLRHVKTRISLMLAIPRARAPACARRRRGRHRAARGEARRRAPEGRLGTPLRPTQRRGTRRALPIRPTAPAGRSRPCGTPAMRPEPRRASRDGRPDQLQLSFPQILSAEHLPLGRVFAHNYPSP